MSRENPSGGDFTGDFATEYPPFQTRPGQVYIGKIVGGMDWGDFFLRPNDLDTGMLDQLWMGMDEFYSTNNTPSLKQLGILSDGMPCAVRHANDRKWHRARVEDASYNMVRFIDTGNVQMCAEDDMRVLLSIYAELSPPASLRCSFMAAAKIPNFVIGRENVKVTLLSKNEPYTIAIGFGVPNASEENATALPSTARKEEPPLRDTTNEQGPQQQPARAEGLSMMRQATRPTLLDDDDTGPGAKGAVSNRLALPSRRGPCPEAQFSRYSIINVRGAISDLHSNCGGIVRQRYLMQRSEINMDQTGFCGGPLLVDDLRRLFRVNERVTYTAKFSHAFMTDEMEWNLMVAEDNDPDYKKKKGREDDPEPGTWVVTNFEPLNDNPTVLVTHAVVTFVSDTVCSLYVRGSELNICAPKDTFPDRIAASSRSLRDLVDVGRSVIVRAQCSPLETGVLRVRTEWVAEAVELVGQMFEERGTMYVVRDTYSVIITEGNVGFGYVFVPNQFVQPAGLPLHEWYGTKVYFRSCVDVPDQDSGENIRYGNRMKAVYAQLMPEETKGPFRFPGIYRPTPVTDNVDDFPRFGDGNEETAKKKLADDDSAVPDLPVDAVRELRMWGVDAIGIDQSPTNPADNTAGTHGNNVVWYAPTDGLYQCPDDDIEWLTPEEMVDATRQDFETVRVANGPSVPTVPVVPVADAVRSTIVAPCNGFAEPSASASGPIVAAAYNGSGMDAEAEFMMSTVEIFVENPLDAETPLLPEVPALPPTHVESVKAKKNSASSGAARQRVSVACQTDGEFELEQVPDPAEKERLFEDAVAEFRTIPEDDWMLMMRFATKLDDERRRLFYKVCSAAMNPKK